MKKFCAVVILFAAALVFTAVWYSPLTAIGDAQAYDNNEFAHSLTGACYAADECVRIEIAGGETELYFALDKISATPVKTVEAGNRTVVYAYSSRVACASLTTSDGKRYNVMAAYGGGIVVIGTPVLQGSY